MLVLADLVARSRMAPYQSVDLELVALGVAHRDGIVVEPVGGQDGGQGGTQGDQPAGFGVDALLADRERNLSPGAGVGFVAAGVDVDVQPFLTVLRSGTTWNQIPDPRPSGSTMRSSPTPRSSSGTPILRQYSSQLAQPAGDGSITYPRAATQNRDDRSGSAQSITSMKLAAIIASRVGATVWRHHAPPL
jgi:hypothetical protein